MKDIVSIPLYLAIIVLNCIEAYLIAKKPAKKRLTSEKMLLSLSIGDVLLGFNGVIGFLREIKVIPSSRFIVTFLNSFIIFSVTFSILHILLLTLDRFISVYFPIRRRTLMSDNLVNICLVLIWIMSFVTSPLIVWHSIAKKSAIYPVFLSVEVFPTLCLLLCVYIMIYRKLRGSPMFGGSHCEASASNYNSSNSYTVTYVENDATIHGKETLGAALNPQNGSKGSSSTFSSENTDQLKMTSIKIEQKEADSVATNLEERLPQDGRECSMDVAGNEVFEGNEIKRDVQNNKAAKPKEYPRRHSSHAYRHEKRILMLGVSIIVSFAICFLPATITFLVFLRFTKKSMPYFVLAYFFAVLNSISNPVLYFFYRYWDKAKRCCCCCC